MTRIYYFTGTGNSLRIAKELGKGLGTDWTPMAGSAGMPAEEEQPDAVGLVFPVYFYDIPGLVQRFIKKLHISKDTFVFCVVTCGGNAGKTLQHVNSLLVKKGSSLDYGKVVFMPDNSIVLKASAEKKARMLREADNSIAGMVESITSRTRNADWKKSGKLDHVIKAFTEWGMKAVYRMDKKEADHERCNRCGTCERVCPVGNISLAGGSYEWGKNCEECFACIHWCPQKAVRFGRINLFRQPSYHHPEITLKDVLEQKK